MNRIRTLILGGGMSGLSCAYHLRSDFLLLEKSNEPGGLSQSVKHDGFVFDHTGHLLHLRHPYTLKLIPELLKDNLGAHVRRAAIYSHGTLTPYPYQANTFGLPKAVVKGCVMGFVQAQLESSGSTPPAPSGGAPESFASWVLRTFGRGFARHFFFPYNEKLWTVPPEVLTAEWVAPFVPRPSVQEIVLGALTPQKKRFGYNATFYYPKQGGIQELAFAFAKGLPGIRLNSEVAAIDLAGRTVRLRSGEVIAYEHLVTSLPLARFLQIAGPLPPDIEAARDTLRWTSVYNLNLGVDRPRISDQHWIYFPEKKYRFYRVGFPMNFSEHMAPKGCSSMYVEVSHEPGRPPDELRVQKECLEGLRDCGLLRRGDRIVTTKVLRIPVAYVIFDKNRTASTEKLLQYLESQRVHSIGRFGGWKYSYMEEAILEGKALAEKLLGRNGS